LHLKVLTHQRACPRPGIATTGHFGAAVETLTGGAEGLDSHRRKRQRGWMDSCAPLMERLAAPPLQRARGRGGLAVRDDHGAPRLDRLYQEGSAQIRTLRSSAADGWEAVLINTAGGLTGGDRFDWTVEVGAGAKLRVITQACEKIYRARDGAARVEVELKVAAGARLDWAPQETILFDGAALERRLEADLDAGARLLLVEAVILGRTAMGERLLNGRFHDRWRVRREGRLVFADDVRLEGEVARKAGLRVTLNGGCAFATLALFDDDDALPVEALRALLGPAGGLSAFDGKLICRIAATDGAALRRILIPALTLLSDGRPPPRVWTN
jgi:urease accessory protein